MLNYIKGELYKVSKRSYTRKLFVYCALISLLFNLLFFILGKISKDALHSGEVYANYSEFVLFSFFLTLFIVHSIFSKDYFNGSLKNPLAFGISRSKIYFGKWLAAIIVSIILMVFLLTLSLLCTSIFFGVDKVLFSKQLKVIFIGLLKLFPLYIGALTVCHCLFFTFKYDVVIFILFIYGMIGPVSLIGDGSSDYAKSSILEFLSKHQQWFPFVNFSKIISAAKLEHLSLISINSYIIDEGTSVVTTGTCYMVGIIYSLIFLLLGWLFFRKREIK